MKSRADVTGFDNSIFKGGIDEFKQVADNTLNNMMSLCMWKLVENAGIRSAAPSPERAIEAVETAVAFIQRGHWRKRHVR